MPPRDAGGSRSVRYCATPPASRLWLALRDIDLDAHWPQIERRWLDRSKAADWLAYPDTQLDLADVRARLVLVSIRAGELDRAASGAGGVSTISSNSRRSAGWPGSSVCRRVGAAVVVSARVACRRAGCRLALLSPARQLAECIAPKLGPILVPAWVEPVPLTAPAIVRGGTRVYQRQAVRRRSGSRRIRMPRCVSRERPLSCFPIVVDGVVMFSDAAAIRAVDLATGKPAVTADGILARNKSPDGSNARLSRCMGPIAHGVPRYTLTAHDEVVFGRVGRLATTQINSQNRNVRRPAGRSRSGARRPIDVPCPARRRRSGRSTAHPVSDGRRVFVAMRHSDVTPAPTLPASMRRRV